MSEVLDIEIAVKKVETSKLNEVDLDNLKFGSVFSDYMVNVDYEDGKWKDAEIKPYQNLTLSPACSALHYGQSIFEGMKAYKSINGEVALFRPEKNAARLNLSAVRMSMPELPEEIFLESLKTLVNLEKDWVPAREGYSLYLRPYMFANDPYIGVRTSQNYKFVIFCCPVGKYYTKKIRVKVADEYVRAVKGGTGFAKAAGNYAATLYPALKVAKDGFDQVLWTDAYEHKYVQEIGTMNFFTIIDGVAYTAPVDGQILEGVTRDSVMTLLNDRGIEVVERPISINEISEAFDNDKLEDAFGTGTAASVSPIAEINYKGKALLIDDGKSIAESIKQELDDIKYGKIEDRHNWMVAVD